MIKSLRIIIAQLNFLVGDIESNAQKITQYAESAKKEMSADLIVFPELALTGYPPEDLLLRDGLYQRVKTAMQSIQRVTKKIDIILGYPIKKGKNRYNAASLISKGKVVATYHKMCLPNYSVFDELRYFTPGTTPCVVDYHGLSLCINICEDLWHKQPLTTAMMANANFVITLNASPFDLHKHEARIKMLHDRAKECSVPILYVNCVGGQDELVFDGGSLVVGPSNHILQRGPFYQESLIPVDVQYNTDTHKIVMPKQSIAPPLSQEARIYGALVLGVHDYIAKNNFPSAILGLSGGIDSALTLAIAVDAIGADRVEGILMPSQFTAPMSIEDALAQARAMQVKTSCIPIEEAFATFRKSLAEEFSGLPVDSTEENIQARCRGIILMAISNKKGAIVLATGNKSEMSVGYSTLYGDMVGGFCVLKDIPKTLVYKLANYRNSINPVIPDRVITRAPTAELASNQKDEDTLPPYSVLDRILELYIEEDQDFNRIIKQGFDPEIVKKIIYMINHNEYKRRQSPPGVRITQRAFGRDRRYPITSNYDQYLQLAK